MAHATPGRLLVTLVTGSQATAREKAIAAALDTAVASAIIMEGLGSGVGYLESLAAEAAVPLIRIAPGCMCCTGNLTLRVHLNRILRHPPAHLFIGLANATHLEQIQTFLRTEPYDALLTLDQVIDAK